MNTKTYILTILCILIVESHGGLIDNVFGTFKNTTHNVASGVGGILSFGKDLVTGHHQANGKELVKEDKGIVGKFIGTLHQGFHNVHQTVRNVFVGEDKNNTKGIIENVYDRMKNKVRRVTDFFKGDAEKRKEIVSDSRDQVLISYGNLNKLIFGNSTKGQSSKIKQALNNMKHNIILMMHHNTMESPNKDNHVNTDGSGLIDIRFASEQLERNLDEDMAGTRTRFHQGIEKLNNNAIRNRNYVENIAKDVRDKEKELMETGGKKIEESAVVFKD